MNQENSKIKKTNATEKRYKRKKSAITGNKLEKKDTPNKTNANEKCCTYQKNTKTPKQLKVRNSANSLLKTKVRQTRRGTQPTSQLRPDSLKGIIVEPLAKTLLTLDV